MNSDEIQKLAEQAGLVGLDSGALDRLTALTAEAAESAARLPRLRAADEPAHVFFVPQRTRE